MNSSSYSKRGYLKVKKETTAGTAVIPDTLVEILSESIEVNWDTEQIGGIMGNRSMNLRTSPNRVGPFEGDIELYVEPKTIGHILNGLFGEDVHTTAEAGVSELSTFEPRDVVPAYTLDIARAGLGYINRFFGVRFIRAQWVIDGNRLKLTLRVSAQRVFTNARLTADKAAGNELLLDQTSGIVQTDSLLVIDKDAPDTTLATLTVTGVTDENTLAVSTIGVSLEEKDIAVIAADTIDDEDYDRSKELTFVGGAEISMGKDDDAMQRLIFRSNCESFELTAENGYEPRWAPTGVDVVDRMPATISLKGISVAGKFGQFHATPEMVDLLRTAQKTGLRFRFIGQVLDSNVAAAAGGTVETDGVGSLAVTIDAAGEAGNDYAIKVVQGTTPLSAALSDKLITVTLDATPASNTTSLVAAVIDGLTGVSCASTGADLVTTVDNPDKIEFSGGRDANEREMVEFDIPNVSMETFTPNLGPDDVLMDDIPFTAERDADDGREIRVRLRNDQTAY